MIDSQKITKENVCYGMRKLGVARAVLEWSINIFHDVIDIESCYQPLASLRNMEYSSKR